MLDARHVVKGEKDIKKNDDYITFWDKRLTWREGWRRDDWVEDRFS